jgi:UDP-N-acetyl-D-glucosamine dehydrogenase
MKIAIIGLGYVGLPLSLQFTASGVDVIGLDVDAKKIESIQEGSSYIKHISDESIQAMVDSGRLEASTDFSRIAEVEAIVICVPTPLNKYREPDISYVLATGRAIAPYLGATIENVAASLRLAGAGVWEEEAEIGETESSTFDSIPAVPLGQASPHQPKLVVLESTSYPGTTEEDLLGVLEAESGLKAGIGFRLAFSPEREDPGNPLSKVASIPKVLGGYTPACLEAALALYGKAIDNLIPVSSCRAAEATKLLENIFRSVNIALVNELKVVYEAMGIDIWETIEAAKTKPFGFMPFYPGPGLGGHCIPVDPFYLTWKAREYGQHTRFIELAGEINAGMGIHVVKKVGDALNLAGKPIRGSRVLVIGLAYKADVDDMRESPTFVLMDGLKLRGAEISYFDPWIPEVMATREHRDWTGSKSVEWNEEVISSFDCIVISTAHSIINYHELHQWCNCIVDTRNAMVKAGLAHSSNVFKA